MTENSHSARSRRRIISGWLRAGPFAMAAATLQGGMNYAVILYLTFAVDVAATGEYRTYFAWYGLLALVSMQESNKQFVRAVVEQDRDGMTAVFVNRLLFAWGGVLCIVLAWITGETSGKFAVPDLLVAVASLSALIYPFDFYIARMHAERKFFVLFVCELIKYGGALAVFVMLVSTDHGVATALIAQMGFMALCQAVLFAAFVGRSIQWSHIAGNIKRLVRSSPARDARTYSFANMFPASLEHIDKLLVGAVFGLEFLGIYTLAYSTGRFLYNILKPAMYVYYRRFVEAMPGWPLLRKVSFIFTGLGLGMAAMFLVAIAYVPEMDRFRSGQLATVILFCGYGLGILHAIYGQAFALNKDSVSSHALKAHLLATLASLVVLAAALQSEPATALVLLALQYPLRDGLSVLLMDRYRRLHRTK